MSTNLRLLVALTAIIASTVIAQTVQDGAFGPLMTVALSERGVNESVSGLIVAAPWVTTAFFTSLIVVLAKRFGSPLCMVAGVLLSSACFLWFPIIDNTWAWLGISCALGLGTAIRWICGEAWLIATAPAHMLGRVVGVHETLIGLAGAVGPTILVFTGTQGFAPFLGCAAVLAVAALLPPIAARFALARSIEDEKHSPIHGSSAVRVATLAAFVGGAAEGSAHAFLPVVVTERQFGGWNTLFAASLFSLGGTLFQYPFSILADRRGRGDLFGLASAGLIIVALIIPVTQGTSSVFASILVTGAICGTFYTLAALTVANAMPSDELTAGIARLAFGSTLGSIFGPLAMGIALDALGHDLGLGVCLAGFGVVGLLGDFAITRMHRTA
ncbi:MAG: MFS transporter [Hyphomicrobium sp.]|uniref:MFS transporter n=1 Tax=Hyphomicrobium sp. TaxID=82 RepID=UPI003D151A5C